MNLSRDDVADLLALLDGLPFEELDLQTPSFRLILRRDHTGGWSQELDVLRAPNVEGPAAPNVGGPDAAPEREDEVAAGRGGGTAPGEVAPDGAVAVRSPIVGTFYRAARPGAEPFVEVGDQVDASTVIGLVETMKLFNSVEAGVAGTVVEIVTDNATAVEQEQVLLYVRPTAAS